GVSVSDVRWATCLGGGSGERVGVVQGQEILALPSGTTLLDLLGDSGERLRDAGQAALAGPDEVFPLPAVTVLPPVPRPPSVRDFYAFEQHVRTARHRRGLEMDPERYELPVFSFCNPGALVGPSAELAV